MRLSPAGIANSEERNRHPKTQVPNTGTWGTLRLSTSAGIAGVISSHRFHVNKFQIVKPGPPALFAYCAGIEGSQTASVSLIDAKTKAVVWAYNVHKGGSSNFQSSAEACAKHLKNWLEHKGK